MKKIESNVHKLITDIVNSDIKLSSDFGGTSMSFKMEYATLQKWEDIFMSDDYHDGSPMLDDFSEFTEALSSATSSIPESDEVKGVTIKINDLSKTILTDLKRDLNRYKPKQKRKVSP